MKFVMIAELDIGPILCYSKFNKQVGANVV